MVYRGSRLLPLLVLSSMAVACGGNSGAGGGGSEAGAEVPASVGHEAGTSPQDVATDPAGGDSGVDVSIPGTKLDGAAGLDSGAAGGSGGAGGQPLDGRAADVGGGGGGGAPGTGGGLAPDAPSAGGAGGGTGPADARDLAATADATVLADATVVTADAASEPGVPPSGSVPAELVGIWQETRSSAGEYTNGWGQDFTISSGFSVQLKVAADGSYYWAHDASGVAANCGSVNYFDQSVGTATLQGNVLTLLPSQRRLDYTDCGGAGSKTLPNDPIELTIAVKESRFAYGGLRTYVMSVDGASHPLELTLLNRSLDFVPIQPAQPAGFVAGEDPPYTEWQGLFVAASGTDSTFFDPGTGAFHFPELNGSPHRWLRFAGEQYELATALQNVNPDGACKLDVIYYEQGKASLAMVEAVTSDHFIGHGRFVASAARLITRIRECGQDDGTYQYDLPPLTAFYRWIYFASDPERITLDCTAFPQNEWQSLVCTDAQPGFIRR